MQALKKQYKLAELIDGLEVTLRGNPDCLISGISVIQEAEEGHLTFLSNPLYKKYLPSTEASAIVLDETHAIDCPKNAIISSNPYFVYAKIAQFFQKKLEKSHGIHPTTVVGDHTSIHESVSIGPHCVIGNEVKIGANVVIGPGSIIGDRVMIDEDCLLDAKVTVYHDVSIGKRTHLCSGVVLGCDGFGFAKHQGAWHKVPQLGTVIIGSDVDIGANTSVDRGAIENTIIEDGVKLDNLIQIGHNVRIGSHTIIAGCVAIAGSTIIGKNCMIGGASCIAGHISICDNAMITGMTGVEKSIHEPGMYSSGIIGAVPRDEFTKNNARFYRLENLMKRVKKIESILKNVSET